MMKGVPLLSTSRPFETKKPAKLAAGKRRSVQRSAARRSARRVHFISPPGVRVHTAEPRADHRKDAPRLMQAKILMSRHRPDVLQRVWRWLRGKHPPKLATWKTSVRKFTSATWPSKPT